MKPLTLQTQATLSSVDTFHGTDYYVTVQLGNGIAVRQYVQPHEEEKVLKAFIDAQPITLGELEAKGEIPTV